MARKHSAATLANLPNFLTLLRIAAIPLLVWLLRDPSPSRALVTFFVYLAASLTDFFDGYVARRYGLTTAFGQLLDPLADKLLVVSALVMLALMDRTPVAPAWLEVIIGNQHPIPAWLLVIIIARELAVTGLRSIAATEGIVLGAEASGKVKMLLQSIGVHGLIIHYTYFGFSFYTVGVLTLLAATAVGVWSAVEYHLIVFRQMTGRALR